jgi:hypothetical protein
LEGAGDSGRATWEGFGGASNSESESESNRSRVACGDLAYSSRVCRLSVLSRRSNVRPSVAIFGFQEIGDYYGLVVGGAEGVLSTGVEKAEASEIW